jgi:hypothetical protein
MVQNLIRVGFVSALTAKEKPIPPWNYFYVPYSTIASGAVAVKRPIEEGKSEQEDTPESFARPIG